MMLSMAEMASNSSSQLSSAQSALSSGLGLPNSVDAPIVWFSVTWTELQRVVNRCESPHSQ